MRDEPAIEVLRQVWAQQYAAPDERGAVRLRSAKEVPPPEQWIVSPYDRDARFSVKRGVEWVGYKVHLTEACDADRPELITHVATTPATTQDDAVTGTIHDDLAQQQLLPAGHLVDAGYTSAEHLVRSRAAHGIDLVGPVAANASWQARDGTGFDLQRFAIEWDTQTVVCPQGKRSRSWRPRSRPGGLAQIHVRFDRHDCLACVCRAGCTRSKTKPRTLAFQPQAHQVALEAARLRQATPEFKERYALRAGAESTLSQAIRVGDLRHTRYLGLARTHLQQLLIATAVNVIRTLAWLNEVPRGPTRVSRWVALAAAA